MTDPANNQGTRVIEVEQGIARVAAETDFSRLLEPIPQEDRERTRKDLLSTHLTDVWQPPTRRYFLMLSDGTVARVIAVKGISQELSIAIHAEIESAGDRAGQNFTFAQLYELLCSTLESKLEMKIARVQLGGNFAGTFSVPGPSSKS